MQITDVRVRKVPGTEGKLKAYCSVVIDGMFVVHEIRVVEGPNGVFVAMPRRRTAEGEYRDIAHPITADARDYIQKVIIDAYQEAEKKGIMSA